MSTDEILKEALGTVLEADQILKNARASNPEVLEQALRSEFVPRYQEALGRLQPLIDGADQQAKRKAIKARAGYLLDLAFGHMSVVMAFRKIMKAHPRRLTSDETTRIITCRTAAIGLLRESLEIERNAPGLYNLATLEEMAGNFPAAQAALQETVQIDGSGRFGVLARQGIAEIASGLGQRFPPQAAADGPGVPRRRSREADVTAALIFGSLGAAVGAVVGLLIDQPAGGAALFGIVGALVGYRSQP